ncbi:MAG: hypothetical protein E6Q97_28505 [Desulfurellales bacterium]|nr:MAG: hypothetical protein E6Q97_28505 [Desulfurellales bacterium]
MHQTKITTRTTRINNTDHAHVHILDGNKQRGFAVSVAVVNGISTDIHHFRSQRKAEQFFASLPGELC